MRTLGALNVAFYTAHAAAYVWKGTPENALWGCHMGTLISGIGLLMLSANANAVGAFWLTIGSALWIVDIVVTRTVMPTSILSHVGGLIVSYTGMKKLGLPKGVWWKALSGLAVLVVLSRLITPPKENVNLSHRVYDGSPIPFSSHAVYLVTLAVGIAIVFGVLQWGLPKAGFKKRE